MRGVQIIAEYTHIGQYLAEHVGVVVIIILGLGMYPSQN